VKLGGLANGFVQVVSGQFHSCRPTILGRHGGVSGTGEPAPSSPFVSAQLADGNVGGSRKMTWLGWTTFSIRANDRR